MNKTSDQMKLHSLLFTY